jgi:hypothetical protein
MLQRPFERRLFAGMSAAPARRPRAQHGARHQEQAGYAASERGVHFPRAVRDQRRAEQADNISQKGLSSTFYSLLSF